MTSLDPACAGVVAALEGDPFYRAICGNDAEDAVRRRTILAQYFDYSIHEGRVIGRSVHLADPALGVAVWLLPQDVDVESRAAHDKRAFLEAILDEEGRSNYNSIVKFMKAKALTMVGEDAWYLSILAVDPTAHGRGYGRGLLEPTIAEADRAGATCYLETFNPRNHLFYERFGFATTARFAEPTTGASYTVMIRAPRPLAENGAPEDAKERKP